MMLTPPYDKRYDRLWLSASRPSLMLFNKTKRRLAGALSSRTTKFGKKAAGEVKNATEKGFVMKIMIYTGRMQRQKICLFH